MVRSFTNDVVEYGHAAYQTTRLDQASSLVPLTSLYILYTLYKSTYKLPSCRDLLTKNDL